MRSGVCGAVCRPACGAGKDSENKQPLICESSSRACVRVSTAVGSSDAEGEGWGCKPRRGGRGVGVAETDRGPELRGAMAAAPWPAPCCVRRGARPVCLLGLGFRPAAVGRPSWLLGGAGTENRCVGGLARRPRSRRPQASGDEARRPWG